MDEVFFSLVKLKMLWLTEEFLFALHKTSVQLLSLEESRNLLKVKSWRNSFGEVEGRSDFPMTQRIFIKKYFTMLQTTPQLCS